MLLYSGTRAFRLLKFLFIKRKMIKYQHLYALFLMSFFHPSCGQNQTNVPKDNIKSETKDTVTSYGPNSTVRNIKQDRNGNILIASYTGVFRYDGKSFTNITSTISWPSLTEFQTYL